MSNRLSILRRRGLAFPGGFTPGIDLSHPAAKGLRFSGVTLPGGRFVSLRDAKKGTVTSTFTNAIHGIVGPTITSTGTGQIAFAGQQLTAPSSITIGAIIVGPADGTNGLIINTTSASAACPMFWKDPGTNTLSLTTDTGVHSTNSTIPITATVPYFVAVSYASLTAPIKFAVTNLFTGVITQSSIANTFTAVASNGTYCIAGDGVGDSSSGIVAAVMFSTAGITSAEMWAWAKDPWGFWYPAPAGLSLDSEIMAAKAVAGGTFQAAWAVPSNQIPSGGYAT